MSNITLSELATIVRTYNHLDANHVEIINQAVANGYVVKLSVTQVQFTDESLEKAKRELPSGDADNKNPMTFRAIVINEKGAYEHLNGHTFEADKKTAMQDLAVNRVVLLVPQKSGEPIATDFQFKNVLIVNVDHLAQRLYDNSNWYGDSSLAGRPLSAFNGLKRWAEVHGVKLSPTYTPTV